MNGFKVFSAILLCSALMVGCGSDNNGSATNNGTSNNGATNNGAPNNGATNNGTATNNGAATNNGTTANNGTVQNNGTFPDEPYVTEFTYYEETDDGFAGTKSGITLGVVGLQISSLQGNQKTVSQEDADAFVAAHLGQATIDAMRDGWNCPDNTGADVGMDADAGSSLMPPTWFFEARIQENGNSKSIQEITGCYEAGDRAVLDIIEGLDELAGQYGVQR